jgi:hypothetical protein
MQARTRIMFGVAGAAALTLGAAAAYAVAESGHDPMTMFDSDGNGSLSLAEVRQGAQTMFAKVDADKDGRVTMEEFVAHHRMAGHHRGPHGGDKAGPPEGRRAGPPHGPLHMDTDGDGAVSLAEMQSALEAHFARADADGNGSVSREEMEAAHRTMREGH